MLLRSEVVDFIFPRGTFAKTLNIIQYMYVYVPLYTLISINLHLMALHISFCILNAPAIPPFATPTFSVPASLPSHSPETLFSTMNISCYFGNTATSHTPTHHPFSPLKKRLQGISLKPPPTMGTILPLTCVKGARKRWMTRLGTWGDFWDLFPALSVKNLRTHRVIYTRTQQLCQSSFRLSYQT